jgi:histidine triad (HIT) family protein
MPEYAKLMGPTPAPPCPFCEIIHGRAPGDIVERWPDTIALRPLNPVVDGHLLVIPKGHADSALSDPAVTSLVMHRAAELGRLYGCDLNLITSVGPAATQTVRHFHVHLVPRFEGDGLALPWTPKQAKAVTVDA